MRIVLWEWCLLRLLLGMCPLVGEQTGELLAFDFGKLFVHARFVSFKAASLTATAAVAKNWS